VRRERAGTVTGYAAGLDATEPARDPLAETLACFLDEPALWWSVLAERLAQRWPERWADTPADAISAQLRNAGVPSVTVSMGGGKARGCQKDAIEAAIAGGVTARSEG
jgi:DNA segregation ATPase FtsK/SpoIIIE, S-DNA-T family